MRISRHFFSPARPFRDACLCAFFCNPYISTLSGLSTARHTRQKKSPALKRSHLVTFVFLPRPASSRFCEYPPDVAVAVMRSVLARSICRGCGLPWFYGMDTEALASSGTYPASHCIDHLACAGQAQNNLVALRLFLTAVDNTSYTAPWLPICAARCNLRMCLSLCYSFARSFLAASMSAGVGCAAKNISPSVQPRWINRLTSFAACN